jgi:glycosyltransferase involved in cell wall biosynthesis
MTPRPSTSWIGVAILHLSVILCTYNRAEPLRKALNSLAAATVPDGMEWELLVVDNNSTDHTRSVVEEGPPRVNAKYLFERRQGKSWALNTGIAASRGRVLAFTDDDVEFDAGWLRNILAPFDGTDVVGVGGKIESVWDGPAPRWWRPEGDRRLFGAIVHFDLGPTPVDLSSPPFGANMAFRRDVFDRIGGFRTDLGPAGDTLLRSEDTELATRAMTCGRVVYAPDAVVFHPIMPVRLHKSYVRRWYFGFGRSMARVEGRSPSWATWFGVPRYLCRQFASSALKAVLGRFSRDAFYFELAAVQTAGAAYEFWSSRNDPHRRDSKPLASPMHRS